MFKKVKRNMFEIIDPENLCFGSIMSALGCTSFLDTRKKVFGGHLKMAANAFHCEI